MAANVLIIFIVTIFLNSYECSKIQKDVFNNENFVFWPNAIIPFYIDPRHFDKDQRTAIMTTLEKFSYKTCLQFKPVFDEPKLDKHVLVIENPQGIRKCVIDKGGHPADEPHRLTFGFECLLSPYIEMMIMRALGFPFEHNRASRGIFIDVLLENIEPSALDLFTKERILPADLRALPYDVNSVMHFTDREYSKNGHRTFIFKQPKTLQNRVGLSPIDLQKINIIYGPECKIRDRLAKIDICKNYPVNKRRKREVDVVAATVTNLRINRDIYPTENVTDDAEETIKDLGIEEEVQELIEKVYNISETALKLARNKHCSANKTNIRSVNITSTNYITNIVGSVSNYIRAIVNNAIANLTVFCESEMKMPERCGDRHWKSTKIGQVLHHTQHRPPLQHPTKHYGSDIRPAFASSLVRSGKTGNITDTAARIKRNVDVGKKDIKSQESVKVEEALKVSGPPITNKDLETKTHVKKENAYRRKHYEDNSEHSSIERSSDGSSDNSQEKGGYQSKKRKRINMNENYGQKRKESYGKIRDDLLKLKEEQEEIRDYSSETSKHLDDPRGKIKNEREVTAVNEAEEETFGKSIEKNRESDEEIDKKLYMPIRPQRTTRQIPGLPKTVPLSQMNKDYYADRIWPDGVVPYVIEKNTKYDLDDVRERLKNVNEILKTYTCVHIEEIREGEENKYEDYIVLGTTADFITGRVGGKQQFGVLELFEGGQHRQHAAMIVMAMLGFYFELARHDRDKYVRVHLRHIRPDKLHHFEKLRADATLSLPYDYKSATHPAWQFWRRIGHTGISTVATYKDKDPDGKIMKSFGQNARLLSKLDIVKINSIYGTACFQNDNSNETN